MLTLYSRVCSFCVLGSRICAPNHPLISNTGKTRDTTDKNVRRRYKESVSPPGLVHSLEAVKTARRLRLEAYFMRNVMTSLRE